MEKYEVVAAGMLNFDVNVEGFEAAMLREKLSFPQGITLSGGGDAQNCAVSLAALGVKTAMCGRLGNDYAGDMCLQMLAGKGLGTGWVKRTDSATAIAINLVSDQENPVLYRDGANQEFCDADVPDELLAGCQCLTLNSFFGCGAAGAALLQRAQGHGVVTVADTTTLAPGDTLADIADCMPFLDYFLPSYNEAAALTGEREPAAIAGVFRQMGCAHVVIKLGGDGCFFDGGGAVGRYPGYAVPVVDTTGCGDNFVAGFVCGLVRGKPLRQCMALANAAGAITARHLGSNGALRDYGQLVEFLQKYDKTMDGVENL